MTGHRLTRDEIHTARLMRSEGRTIARIARELGRSREAVGDACKGIERVALHGVHSVIVPDHVLAARDKRFSLHPRDITAAIAGDPLPGMSALDRKLVSVATKRPRPESAALST